MRAFSCQTCGRRVHFENSVCLLCGTALGFRWADRELVAAGAAPRCANAALAGCNWLVAREGELCASCALTRTRPADDDSEGLEAFHAAEAAKRRLLFELGELGLRVEGLAFDSVAVDPVTRRVYVAGLQPSALQVLSAAAPLR